jgi:hypothetical protein
VSVIGRGTSEFWAVLDGLRHTGYAYGMRQSLCNFLIRLRLRGLHLYQISKTLYNIMPQMGIAHRTYSTIPSTIIHANLKSLELPKSVQNGARNPSITVSVYSKAALVGNPFRKSIGFSVLACRQRSCQTAPQMRSTKGALPIRPDYQWRS